MANGQGTTHDWQFWAVISGWIVAGSGLFWRIVRWATFGRFAVTTDQVKGIVTDIVTEVIEEANTRQKQSIISQFDTKHEENKRMFDLHQEEDRKEFANIKGTQAEVLRRVGDLERFFPEAVQREESEARLHQSRKRRA